MDWRLIALAWDWLPDWVLQSLGALTVVGLVIIGCVLLVVPDDESSGI